MCIFINIVYEDELSGYVMTKMLSYFGDKFVVSQAYNCKGNGKMKNNIEGYNRASEYIPFFVLTDLDNCGCPLDLIADWFTKVRHENMVFRIAIKEVEAWLLADNIGFSEYLGISVDNFPRDSDKIDDPKRLLINLTKISKKRVIKSDIIPKDNYGIGPNYNGRLFEFVNEYWNIDRALHNSVSLKRAIFRLDQFTFST